MKKLWVALLWASLIPAGTQAKDNFEQLAKLYKDKQFDQLEKICQTRLKTNPRSMDSYYFLSMTRMAQGKADEALPFMMNFEKCHNEAEALESKKEGKPYSLADPYYMDLYFLLGEYYARKQRFGRALTWLNKARSAYQDDPVLQFLLGRCYAGRKDYESAIQAFQKEAELDPKDPSPLYNTARCYAEQGKAAPAMQWLKKAVTAHPAYKQDVQRDQSFQKVRDSETFKELTAP